ASAVASAVAVPAVALVPLWRRTMLLHSPFPSPVSLALAIIALLNDVAFGGPRRFETTNGIGMNVSSPVVPGAPPGSIVDDYYMRAPVEAVVAPAPRLEGCAQGDAVVKPYRTTDGKPTPRGDEDHSRIVIWHIDDAGIHGS